jgi:hypothetical protein
MVMPEEVRLEGGGEVSDAMLGRFGGFGKGRFGDVGDGEGRRVLDRGCPTRR